MRIFRASEISVVCDDFVYKFDTKQEADSFERCLQDHSLDKCRIYYRPTMTHRCPVKLQSQLDFMTEAQTRRRLTAETDRKEQRQKKFAENRSMESLTSAFGSLSSQDSPPPSLGSTSLSGLPISTSTSPSPPVLLPFSIIGSVIPSTVSIRLPYEGKHVCYVVHGHGGYLAKLAQNHPQANYPKVLLRFYCKRDETTQATERRDKLNAPTKLIEALLGSKADIRRVHETIEPGQNCEPLMFMGDPNPLAWPKQGIWFVAREQADAQPCECVKIAEAPSELTLFQSILNNTIYPDMRKRSLKAPIEIFWIACRASIQQGQNAVTAVANPAKL